MISTNFMTMEANAAERQRKQAGRYRVKLDAMPGLNIALTVEQLDHVGHEACRIGALLVAAPAQDVICSMPAVPCTSGAPQLSA